MYKFRHFIFIIIVLLSSILSLKAQDTIPDYQSKKFKSLELNVGFGLYAPSYYPIPITLIYHQNILSRFSYLVFSQLGLQFKTDKNLNVKYSIYNWVEGVGMGGAVGNKFFTVGLYGVAGGRFYYSKFSAVNNNLYHEPVIVTKEIVPELGLLINVKMGKKKLYFTSQLYASLYPIDNFLENYHNFSVGVGYKF